MKKEIANKFLVAGVSLFFSISNFQSLAQNIGVSTNTPTAKLQINNTGTIRPALKLFDSASNSGTPVIQFQNAGGNNFWQIGGNMHEANPAGSYFDIYNSQAGSYFITVRGDGNVGIGNSSPAYKLDVNGNTMVNGFFNVTGLLKLNGSSGFAGQVLVSNGTFAPSWEDPFIPLPNWAESGTNIYNSNAGNVGIGTSTPVQKLDVNGRMNITNGVIQRGGAAITATSDLGLYSRVAGNYIRFVTNAAPILFFSDDNIGTNANMIIQADGKVGIGNSAPQSQLDVSGFTKLGADAPKIKVKKITGTTSSSDGGLVTIVHGLDSHKILAVDVLVQASIDGTYRPPGFTYFPGYEYNFSLYGPNIYIENIYLNSADILSKPVRILITYEE